MCLNNVCSVTGPSGFPADVQDKPRGSEYPNSKGFRSQNPYSEWFLDLETLLFGYLDP